MIIRDIAITRFRNIGSLSMTPHEKLTLFTGKNGQGKSSILEALGFLLTGRSFRTSRESELIQWHSSHARIDGHVEQRDRTAEISVVLSHRDRRPDDAVKKQIVIDGVPLRKLSQYIGKMEVVIFSRIDLEIVAGSPQNRRHFLDHLLCRVGNQYLFSLQRYHTVLRERNNWLRTHRKAHPAMDEVWKEQLAQYGALIIRDRQSCTVLLSELLSAVFSHLSMRSHHIELTYRPSFPFPDGENLKEHFLHHLERTRTIEEARKTTVIGPHRDDLSISLDGSLIRTYGSQGQQRLASLALKLAEGEAMKRHSGEEPLLLLDDCFSELDKEARERLWTILDSKGQVFMTSNDIPLEEKKLHRCRIYQVVEGSLPDLCTIQNAALPPEDRPQPGSPSPYMKEI